MTFRIGQRVVCVDAGKSHWDFDPGLKKGSVYTIAAIDEYWEGTGLDLVELPAPKVDGHYQAYRSDRFRPIVERKTDIAIFRKMLIPQGVEA